MEVFFQVTYFQVRLKRAIIASLASISIQWLEIRKYLHQNLPKSVEDAS